MSMTLTTPTDPNVTLIPAGKKFKYIPSTEPEDSEFPYITNLCPLLLQLRQPSPPPLTHPRIYMDILIHLENQAPSSKRLIFDIFESQLPKTVRNFTTLLFRKGDAGNEEQFGYKGSVFHRVVPKLCIQGGNIHIPEGLKWYDPEWKTSIYGKTFDDEDRLGKHRFGSLSMVNESPNTNGTQFFISLHKNPEWLNGKHVVFGQIHTGRDVLRKIESIAGSRDGTPKCKIEIMGGGWHKM